ncbi:helix-turn-helix domain-containing protein [Nocardia sp. NPDC059240]|uniref:AraC family transcriptional regulator n=1 Tax=Nocardia sp. NPDC059240 TaxID=3346786 RepID=UPI0036821E40
MFEGTLPARTAALVHAAALRAGLSPVELSAIPGLDPGLFTEQSLRISSGAVWRIWELLDAAEGPTAGRLVVDTAERGRLGVWDYLFSSGPTLAESLHTMCELKSVVSTPSVGSSTVVDGGILTVYDTTSSAVTEVIPAMEVFLLGLVLRRMREATGEHLVPVRVALTQPSPRNHRGLIEEFGTARIEFDAPCSALTFIDVGRLPTCSDPHLARIYRHHAELQLASFRVHGDWDGLLRNAIHGSLTHGSIELNDVAHRMSISPRTLQRRLHERGTTWRDALDSVRLEQATRLLRETELPVDVIAARIGYADARAFRRAFIRWKDVPPNTFRKHHRAPSADLASVGRADRTG